jgi:hypothetical protein
MITGSERINILKMIEEGKISPAEGVRLLEQGETGSKLPAAETKEGRPRWLRVLVTDTTTGKASVNVKLPINLVDAGVKLGARLSIAMEGQTMEQVNKSIRDGYFGMVLDVVNDDQDERVQIFLE